MWPYIPLCLIVVITFFNAIVGLLAVVIQRPRIKGVTILIDLGVGIFIGQSALLFGPLLFDSDGYVWLALGLMIVIGMAVASNWLGTRIGRWLFC
ncbi:MAG: hypothetical protein AAB480_03520 [Patescibacteria group bacterium]